MNQRSLTFKVFVQFALSAVVSGCLTGCLNSNDEADTETNLFLSERVLNIAHRGGRALRPEHTIIAYEHALEVGADVLEIDVQSTSDGVLVVMHDSDVDRTTDGQGPVQSYTYAELQQLDAGYWYTEDDGETYRYRAQGLQVPSFEWVLARFSNSYFVVEDKQTDPSIVDAMLALVAAAGLTERVVFGSFEDAVNQEIRLADPDVFTNLSLGEVTTFFFLNEESEADYIPPGMFHQIPLSQGDIPILTPEYIARANRFDMKIHVWTINDAQEMRDVIELGVDGIITDDPNLLEQVLAEYGLAN